LADAIAYADLMVAADEVQSKALWGILFSILFLYRELQKYSDVQNLWYQFQNETKI